ncbi:MAG: AraC family transcriptional regulator [Panacagrimonas sp.]
MAGPLVGSIILSGAAEKIRLCGRKPGPIARKSGVPLAALSDPDLLVSGRAVMAFFELAATTCRRRTFGLEMSARAHLGAVIGPLWVLLRNAQTVEQMCIDLAKHFDLYSSAAVMAYQPTKAGGLLHWSVATGHGESEVQMSEYAVATILGEIRMHGAPGWTPPGVHFRHEAPSDLRLHRRIFGPHLHFNGEHNSIELDAAILRRPHSAGEPRVRSLVQKVLRDDDGSPAAPIELQVEGLIRVLLPYGSCSADDVSQAIGISTRTLQLHLNQAGQSFRSIKDSVRADLAQKYLQHSGLNVTQVASRLGYGDPTSLSRSFRRWHGTSVRSQRSALKIDAKIFPRLARR